MSSKKEEKQDWLALAERSLEKLWNNKKDEEAWSKYLNKEAIKSIKQSLKEIKEGKTISLEKIERKYNKK